MPDLTIRKEWVFEDKDFDPVATISYRCSEGQRGVLTFKGYDPAPQVIEVDEGALCFLQEHVTDSRAESETSCPGLIDVVDATECVYTTTIFPFAIVPTLSPAGIAIMAALLASLALIAIKKLG